jgi:hypothetical protein
MHIHISHFIDAFGHVKLKSISIESRNDIFCTEHEFLIDIVHRTLVRNVSDLSHLDIPQSIETLCSSCV